MLGNENRDVRLLWSAFLKGDNKAFVRIYYLHIEGLLTYGKKLARNRELLFDAVQEVFMDMFLKRGKPHTVIDNPKAYLFTALRNSILKKTMLDRRFGTRETDDELADGFKVEYSFEDQWISSEISDETRNKLYQAIEKLTAGQKEIIYLKFEEGLGYREIAEMTGTTAESARKQLYRALLSLRQMIGNERFYVLFTLLLKKVPESCPRFKRFQTT